MVNVGNYTIHGWYGYYYLNGLQPRNSVWLVLVGTSRQAVKTTIFEKRNGTCYPHIFVASFPTNVGATRLRMCLWLKIIGPRNGFFKYNLSYPIGSMYGIFTVPTFAKKIKHPIIHVGKYTNPMDPMGTIFPYHLFSKYNYIYNISKYLNLCAQLVPTQCRWFLWSLLASYRGRRNR